MADPDTRAYYMFTVIPDTGGTYLVKLDGRVGVQTVHAMINNVDLNVNFVETIEGMLLDAGIMPPP
jgi:hypothetical protein